MKKSNKGFTLVELIIVIAILAIIMLIAIPNFSGIQQRMQVRADKSTAAQIGKAIRIWLTEKSSDGDDTSIATMPSIAIKADGSLEAAASQPTLSHYENLAGIKDYISVDNEPSSLSIEDSKAKSATQYYAPVLAGTDRTSKIMIIIQGTGTASETDAGTWTIAYNADTDGDDTEDSFGVDYDGIGPGIAYIEP